MITGFELKHLTSLTSMTILSLGDEFTYECATCLGSFMALRGLDMSFIGTLNFGVQYLQSLTSLTKLGLRD